jgi:hypothetical protein
MTTTPRPVISALLEDPSGLPRRHPPVTWYSVAVTIRRTRYGTTDERTIALPMLAYPERAEIAVALEALGWGGYEVVGFMHHTVQS